VKVLGIETSCDECAAAVVEDGRRILSNVVATQIPYHAPFNGVVPEIAGRKHAEWIYAVVENAIFEAGLSVNEIDGVAVTSRPGLAGALFVGLSFAKAFAWARRLPFIACDHILAHLYAARLDGSGSAPEYPFLGLLVSGGHTLIARADDFETLTVLGATADDAAGEAFDKVAKHYGWGYPGGKCIDELARSGDADAFAFPRPQFHANAACSVSYSGLKTAAIHQIELFRRKTPVSGADIAASFQKAAVETLLRALYNAVDISGLRTVVAGGGVAANSCLRARLAERSDIRSIFPPLELCGDNGAMVAGLGYEYLSRGRRSPFSTTAEPRVHAFKDAFRPTH
jgi:N6-L-threonylcarbamoyladenine synthase